MIAKYMMDSISGAQRSAIMSKVKSKNTGPEMMVRQMLNKLGYRYRLHLRNLPGKPDLAFPGRRKAVFVHGCFWHGCRYAARFAERGIHALGQLQVRY